MFYHSNKFLPNIWLFYVIYIYTVQVFKINLRRKKSIFEFELKQKTCIKVGEDTQLCFIISASFII